MSTRINIILCLALLSVYVPNASAQRRRTRTAAVPTRSTAKPTWVITTAPRDEDGVSTALVKLEPLPVATAPAQPKTLAHVAASFTLTGQPPAQPNFVSLTFFSRAATCRFGKAPDSYGEIKPDLTLLLDEKPLPLAYQATARENIYYKNAPFAEGVWWGQQETEAGDCAESVGAFVTPQTFARITAARSVAVKIGATTFNLDATLLNAFRDLARQLPPTRP
ncbi:MAG: hypothetical protein ACJ74W_08855 [Pyrinomonadaceae bacterium]